MPQAIVGDAGRRATLLAAYRMADERREDVIVVLTPRPKYDWTDTTYYFVPASGADSWELTNGVRVQWRVT